MKCKVCGKELIGKEKFFCKSCWSKGKDTSKKVLIRAGGLALSALAIVISKDRITDIFKGDS